MKHYGRKDGVKYENRAVGGTTTAVNLPMLPMLVADTMEGSANHTRGVDMIFIDFSVNDEESVRNNPLNIGEFSFNKYDKILAATEAAVRYILDVHPNSAILLMDATCQASSNAAHQAAASLYGIPYLRVCGTGIHFPARVHETMNASLVEWWNILEKTIVNISIDDSVISQLPNLPLHPVTPDALASYFNVCAKPLTVYDARAAYFDSGLAPNVINGDWALELDHNRTDKASWTSHVDGSMMEFPLKFGLIPQVSIIYTKGYDDTFGAIKVNMPDTPSFSKNISMIFHGCCESNNVTQSELKIVHAGLAPHLRRLRGSSPNLRLSQEKELEKFLLLPYSSAKMRVTCRSPPMRP